MKSSSPLVGILYSRIYYFDHHRGNIGAYAIAFDKWNDGIIWNVETQVFVGRNRMALGRHFYVLITHKFSQYRIVRRGFCVEDYILEKAPGRSNPPPE